MSVDGQEYFPIESAKVGLEDIKAYFTRRLRQQPESGLEKRDFPLSRREDPQGNHVFTSLQSQEMVLGEPNPSTIVISPDGRELIGKNPGFLGRIADGTIIEKDGAVLIGHGDEGNVYKVALNGISGRGEYAVKYTFPVSAVSPYTGETMRSFTPRIDDMRLMQWARSDLQSTVGFNYACPEIATFDISVAPYVDGAVSLNTVFNALLDNTFTDSYGSPIPAELTEFIKNKVKPFDKNKLRNYQFCDFYARSITRGLGQLHGLISVGSRQKGYPALVSKRPFFDFQLNELNTLVKLSDLYGYFDTYVSEFQKPQATVLLPKIGEVLKNIETIQALEKGAQKTCWLVELMQGREK